MNKISAYIIVMICLSICAMIVYTCVAWFMYEDVVILGCIFALFAEFIWVGNAFCKWMEANIKRENEFIDSMLTLRIVNEKTHVWSGTTSNRNNYL